MRCSRGSGPKKCSRMYAPDSVAYFWNSPSTVEFILLRSTPSTSRASSSSQPRPQTTLMTFQPAPRNVISSSWITLWFPRTGPSRRCRLQLTTKIRLSRFSRAAIDRPAMDSGSSISPSPTNAHTRAWLVSATSWWSRYRLKRAWATALIGPRPIETVGYSQKSGIRRGCG